MSNENDNYTKVIEEAANQLRATSRLDPEKIARLRELREEIIQNGADEHTKRFLKRPVFTEPAR